MKILVIGDVHLGANQALGLPDPNTLINSRLIDYQQTLLTTIDKGVVAGAEVLIFTGDIFEHRKPTLVQQEMFSNALYYAQTRGIKEIHIVVGNHDQQRLSKTTSLSAIKELNLPNIHVHDDVDSALCIVSKRQINLLFLPYRDRKWLGVETYSEAITKIQAELDVVRSKLKAGLPTLLVGHMAIEGTMLGEGYADLYNENQLFLPVKMFDGIDITLMGHIHEPGVISKSPYIAYVGSMEKRGGFETHNKVYAIVDTVEMSTSFHNEPCRKIFDIDLDFSGLVLEKRLPERLFKEIDTFALSHKLKNSIVRVSLRISAEDEQYCDTRIIVSHLKDNYGVGFCADVGLSIVSPRQARDDRITERISEVDAFKLFIENTTDEPELKKITIDAGIELIRSIGEDDASSQD